MDSIYLVVILTTVFHIFWGVVLYNMISFKHFGVYQLNFNDLEERTNEVAFFYARSEKHAKKKAEKLLVSWGVNDYEIVDIKFIYK